MILSSEALLSLQSEVAKAFKEKSASHVKLVWACEKDVGCQRVLSATYGGCCFDDIMTMSHEKSTAWCATHCKYCPTAFPPSAEGRYFEELTKPSRFIFEWLCLYHVKFSPHIRFSVQMFG